jgi:hypothetical protein
MTRSMVQIYKENHTWYLCVEVIISMRKLGLVPPLPMQSFSDIVAVMVEKGSKGSGY